MTTLDDYLDALAPGEGWSPDWEAVLGRAPRRRVRRRHVVLALVVLLVVAVPLVAVAASSDWWFLRHSLDGMKPSSGPYVVKTGTWSGKQWELVAYPNTDNGLCFGITPVASAANGAGGAMECAPITGFPATKHSPAMGVTYLAGGSTPELPAFVAGPVVDTAATVAIRFGTTTYRTTTFGAPHFAHIRFYALQVANDSFPSRVGQRPERPVRSITGYDRNGRIVACLVPATAHDGISRLGDCRS